MFGLNPTELIIILVIVLLVFGSTRLPKLARSLGEASKEFKEGIKEDGSSSQNAAVVTPPPVPTETTEHSAEPVVSDEPNSNQGNFNQGNAKH